MYTTSIKTLIQLCKPLEGGWDPSCEVLEACDPLSALTEESWGLAKAPCAHEDTKRTFMANFKQKQDSPASQIQLHGGSKK